jgi:lipopolysaccharide transport system ATP-binding protein
MSDVILSVENVSKLYRLGTVGTGTFGGDVQRFWKTKILGQEDPFLKIGQTNDRTSKEKAEFVWALQDINFEVKRGEVLGIIGKNGAGKSTLLKLLSRITSPTTGSIKSAGRMASLLEVGTGFHPELTGRENIFLNGAILGMTKKEIHSKFDEIVDFSGCEMYIDTPTKRYSSGMTVRLGFAVAAFLDPEILVVDEVLAVGDAEFQKKAIGKMKDVSQSEGRTVLFVSHNMASMVQLCNTGLLMENGLIKKTGQINEVIEHYIEDHTTTDKNIKDFRTQSYLGNEAEILDIEFDKTLVYGENLRLRVKLKSNSTLRLDNLNLGIGLMTLRDEVVLFSIAEIGITLNSNITEDFELILNTEKHLMPGNYKVNVALYQNKLGQHRDIDIIRGYSQIQVVYSKIRGYEEAAYWNHYLSKVVFDLEISKIK